MENEIEQLLTGDLINDYWVYINDHHQLTLESPFNHDSQIDIFELTSSDLSEAIKRYPAQGQSELNYLLIRIKQIIENYK